MKKGEFFSFYISVMFFVSIYGWLFGEHSYQGYTKNLSRAIVWPILLFESNPEIDGTTQFTFASSYDKVLRAGPYEGRVYFVESVGLLAFYYYAQENPSVTIKDFNEMSNNGKVSDSFYKAIVEKGNVRIKLAKHIDGMTMGDVIDERDDTIEEIHELLEER